MRCRIWSVTSNRWRTAQIPWDWFCHLTSAFLSFFLFFSKLWALQTSPAVSPLPTNWGFKVTAHSGLLGMLKAVWITLQKNKKCSQVTKPEVVQWWYHYSGLKWVKKTKVWSASSLSCILSVRHTRPVCSLKHVWLVALCSMCMNKTMYWKVKIALGNCKIGYIL